MGKQVWVEDDEKFNGRHPGCMSGILLALVDYHNWQYSVKRMLPYRKQDGRIQGKRNRSPKLRLIEHDSFDEQNLLVAETNHDHVDQRARKASSTNKRSLRARIRALVSQRHDNPRTRAPRVPTHLLSQRTYSIHHLEPSDDWGHPIIFLHKNGENGTSKLTDYNQLMENQMGQEEKCKKVTESLVSKELLRDKKLEENTSGHQFKQYVDILEIFKVKDLFPNVLQNTDGEKSFDRKARLTKCGSFPAASSSRNKNFRPAKLEHKQTERYSFLKGEKLVSDTRGEKLVSDTREAKLVSSNSGPLMADGSAYDPNKVTSTHIRRISSLRESTDRYAQLFDYSSSKLPKLHLSKSLKLTNESESLSSSNAPAFFRRIHSLPHADNYALIHHPESLDEKDRAVLPMITEKYLGLNYDEGPDYVNSIVGKEDISPRAEYSACSREGMRDVDAGTINVLHEELKGFAVEINYEKEQEDISTEIQPNPVLVPETCSEEVKGHAELHNSKANLLTDSDAEISLPSCRNEHSERFDTAKQFAKNHRRITSCMEDDADFIYVRDILERSGFITNGFQETWFSSEHPLDPSLFDELESRYPHEPDCFEEEINALSQHLLLFDLVDEVMFNMFEKSYTYYPKVLSSACHIRPESTGQHFLEEVWGSISRSLRNKPETKKFFDLNCAVSQDLRKDDGWMNLQFDSESLALGLEDLIFDELIEEICF